MKRVSQSGGAEGTGCLDLRAAKQRPAFWGRVRRATPFPVPHPDHGRPSPVTPPSLSPQTLRQASVRVAISGIGWDATKAHRTTRRPELQNFV